MLALFLRQVTRIADPCKLRGTLIEMRSITVSLLQEVFNEVTNPSQLPLGERYSPATKLVTSE